MTILTDEEITLIVRECARGSAINRDGSTSHRIARAIESKIEAKLREQEPVALYDGNKFYANEKSAICGCADMANLNPVFLHPAPVGWTQVQVCTWIGNQLMTEPTMFERHEVCRFVRSLGRNKSLATHFHPTAPLHLPLPLVLLRTGVGGQHVRQVKGE